MHIVTRVVIEPRDGGEPVEIFDRAEEGDVDPQSLLAIYTQRFGPSFDLVVTEQPRSSEPMPIGWLFNVPATFELPGPADQFEMALIPMIDDPEIAQRVSLFERLADQRDAFADMLDRGVIDSLVSTQLHQHDADAQPERTDGSEPEPSS